MNFNGKLTQHQNEQLARYEQEQDQRQELEDMYDQATQQRFETLLKSPGDVIEAIQEIEQEELEEIMLLIQDLNHGSQVKETQYKLLGMLIFDQVCDYLWSVAEGGQ